MALVLELTLGFLALTTAADNSKYQTRQDTSHDKQETPRAVFWERGARIGGGRILSEGHKVWHHQVFVCVLCFERNVW